MFWFSYSVTFVLASAIAIAFKLIRLVLSAVGKAPGLKSQSAPLNGSARI